jgi:glutamate synthase (ferredoxin)
VGDDGNLLSREAANSAVLELPTPVLTEEELQRIREMKHEDFSVRTVSLLYDKKGSLRDALDNFFSVCDQACRDQINILILSDRGIGPEKMAIPSLLAVSALEQHLIRIKKRTAVSVILESGEPRDVHQLAMLIAFGARAVNPYLAHACIRGMCEDGQIGKAPEDAIRDYDKALTAGVLKIASKMGVSVLQAYQSAQLFEAVGLDAGFVETYFTNTPCSLGGTDLSRVEADSRFHHDAAFADHAAAGLPSVGKHKYRRGEGAEEHL